MATGKIKEWRGTYGFIDGGKASNRLFFHINESPELRGMEEYLVEETPVIFDTRPSRKHRGQLEAYNVRLSEHPDEKTQNSSPVTKVVGAKPATHFHNPYTFVPSPPRREAIKVGGFAGDFNPLKCGLDHASLNPKWWTGHIPIKLTTVTPLVLLKTEGKDQPTDKPYDVFNHIPESSFAWHVA